MPINILMPALSPTMTEGNLAKWHVKLGDRIAAGDIIAEIETDKATMEVEAVDDGVVGSLLVPEGAEGVKVNQVIAMLLEEGEDAEALEGAQPAAAQPTPAAPAAAPAASGNGVVAASPLARRVAAQAGVDIAALPGSGPGGRIVLADVEAAIGGDLSAAGLAVTAAPVTVAVGSAPPEAVGGGGRIFASPLARRMASEAGLDLAALLGSGPDGRIVKLDVEAAMAAPPPAAVPEAVEPEAAVPEAVTPEPIAASPPVAAPVAAGAAEPVKLSTMRRVIAERMTESKTTVPHFYLTVDCEIDDLLAVRTELNRRAEPDKISINDIVIRACAVALREVPEANVSWHGEGTMLRHATVDVAVAVALEDGLITPVIRDADRKGIGEIAREMKALAERARAGKLMPEEYQGATFTISNLGMFGVKQFDAVINPPQACILAVGAGERRAVVRDDAIVAATVMSLTLSVDHRVVDGAIGARLLAAIKRNVEYPPAMLL